MHVCAVVLTVRLPFTPRELYWLGDKEGHVTRVSYRPSEGCKAFQWLECDLEVESKVETEG